MILALHFTFPGLGTIHDVIVTRLTPDGKYHVQTRDGTSGMDVNDPNAVRLVDDDGNNVQPTVESTTEENLKIRLQAAENALLFLMDMNMGGMI